MILLADVSGGSIGALGTLVWGVVGDPRASSQNDLTADFHDDYVYTAATRTGAVGVWSNVRNAADRPALDAWRMSLQTGTSVPKPASQKDCPATFRNSDIYGAAVSAPMPGPHYRAVSTAGQEEQTAPSRLPTTHCKQLINCQDADGEQK